MRRTALIVGIVTVVALAAAGGVTAAVGPVDAPSATLSTAETGDATQTCGYPVEVTDASGETVTLDEEPDDVVVLGPSAAQHMWELGAQEKVVGMPVNQYTAYLNGSEERTNVVDEAGQPVQEEVVALEPDLVLAPNIIPEEAVQNLRSAGLTVYYSPLLTSPSDMYDELERVGKLVNKCENASERIEATQQTISDIEQAVDDEESPTVYYDLGFGWTAGEGTLAHQLITSAGGDNIAAQADQAGYFEISQEVIANNDPEWIVAQEGQPLPDTEAIQGSTAVQEDQIVRVNPNFISQHGPRIVNPLQKMAEAFHPEAIAELEETPTATPEPTATETPVETPTPVERTDTPVETPAATDTPVSTTTPDESADGDGPGFAVAGAVVALAALVIATRYRR